MTPPRIGARVYDLRRKLTGEVVSVAPKVIVCRRDNGRKWFANRRDLRCASVLAIVPYQYGRGKGNL